jgi:hypothetical protein
LNNTLWTQLVINFRSLCLFFVFSSCSSSIYHDGLGRLVCAQSEFINSEIKFLQTVGKIPSMGDQPVPKTLPKQENTNTINVDRQPPSEIRNHDLSIWTGEDILCLRTRSHWDRRSFYCDFTLYHLSKFQIFLKLFDLQW